MNEATVEPAHQAMFFESRPRAGVNREPHRLKLAGQPGDDVDHAAESVAVVDVRVEPGYTAAMTAAMTRGGS